MYLFLRLPPPLFCLVGLTSEAPHFISRSGAEISFV